jgi:hypothetical protein
MTDETTRRLRELLAELASGLNEYDNGLYARKQAALTEILLAVRMLDRFNTDTFGE